MKVITFLGKSIDLELSKEILRCEECRKEQQASGIFTFCDKHFDVLEEKVEHIEYVRQSRRSRDSMKRAHEFLVELKELQAEYFR